MMRNRFLKGTMAASLTAMMAFAPLAWAVQNTVPASLGHALDPAEADEFVIENNHVTKTEFGENSADWATPIPLANIGTSAMNITATQYAFDGCARVTSTFYTFNKFGVVEEEDGPVNCQTSGTIGTANLPQYGTALVVTALAVDVSVPAGSLAGVRISW